MKNRQSQTSIDYQFPEPGELNRRILVRRRNEVPTEDFGSEPQYTDIRHLWAKVRQVSPTVMHASVQTERAVTHYFTVRYRSGITVDDEVVYSGMLYAIKRARDLNSARRFLLLECEELGEEEAQGGMYG